MIVVLGAFDGFHLGHRLLLDRAAELACENGRSDDWGVVTFSPHPGSVVKNREIPVLFTETERDILARYLRIPRTIKIPFTPELASASPDEFLVLLETLVHVSGIVVGKDFRFGRDRGGDTGYLRSVSGRKNWFFSEVEPLFIDGEKVGSSTIRSHVAHGEMRTSRKLMGYPFFFEGEVVPGAGRGRKLGFPTANIHYPSEKVMPRRGVYAASVLVDSKWLPGALNVGLNPTFVPEEVRVRAETHIIDYNGTLYNRRILVFLEQFLRDEVKFDSAAALAEQMKVDVERARDIFESLRIHGCDVYERLASALEKQEM